MIGQVGHVIGQVGHVIGQVGHYVGIPRNCLTTDTHIKT